MLQFVIGILVTPKISESHQMELRKTRPRDGWSGRPKDAKFNRDGKKQKWFSSFTPGWSNRANKVRWRN